MSRQYDIGEIAKMLAGRAEAVCQWLLPGGKREGHEWRAGSIRGETGQFGGKGWRMAGLRGRRQGWRSDRPDPGRAGMH